MAQDTVARRRKAPSRAASSETDESTTAAGTRQPSSTSLASKEHLGLAAAKPVRRRRWWFAAGILFGAAAAVCTVLYVNPTQNTHINWMQELLGDFEVSSLVPDSLLPEDFLRDISRLLAADETVLAVGEFEPAQSLVRSETLEKTHNVILVPGIISSGLESWSTGNCSRPYFRQRLWGTATMFKAIVLDKECWVDHIMLDPHTGLDPPGIKLRAAQGLDAADYFITGYWIWGKAIANLAALGYDSSDMAMAAYDWRLSYHDLERRDQYFSRLQSRIEIWHRTTGKKTVLVAHSMGAQVVHYFMNWVESSAGGGGGPQWVDTHIEAAVNLAGSTLGVPKTLSSLLSGEQRETVQPLASYLLDKFMNRRDMARIFRSWTGLPALLPKGGNAVWGDLDSAPDDPTDGEPQPLSFGRQLRFDSGHLDNQTMESALDLLLRTLSPDGRRLLQRDYSFGLFRTQAEMDAHRDDHRMWSNPLQHQLPNAPNLTIYCLYGHGATTERAYHYTAAADGGSEQAPDLRIDKTVRQELRNVETGVVGGEGDGTVPLLSLGYMCAEGWRRKLFNPHGVRVVTREFTHSPLAAFKDIRGGEQAADHINILGNRAATADILRIVAGRGHLLHDHITSNIRQYARRVDI
ncbi:phospholipid:diacylglycerol acyltransferase [Coemansia spiralis]|nr:phospholipid:diacylglycerol acyltransferase [Coemansia spiralis]